MIVGDVKLGNRNHIKSLVFRSNEKIFTDFFKLVLRIIDMLIHEIIMEEIKLF